MANPSITCATFSILPSLRFSNLYCSHRLHSIGKNVPRIPYHVARLVATRDEDCGTCVQIEVNLALKDGVPPDVIRAVLDDRLEVLPDELADVHRVAKSVVEAPGDDDELRQRVRERDGNEGLVDLALGIATARVFPVTKRALGYAKSCSPVQIKV